MEIGRKLFGSLKSLVLGRGITFAFVVVVVVVVDSLEDVVKNRSVLYIYM